MRIAYFSPLPPAMSGIADYSEELLPHLALSAEIDVFVDDSEWREQVRGLTYGVRRASDFAPVKNAYDIVLYHVANNLWHAYIYRMALEYPGVIVLHDFVLHHLILEMTIDRGDWQTYEKELAGAYGELGEQLGRLAQQGFLREVERFLFPLNERIIERSRGVIVHSEYVKRRIKQVFPDVPVRVIPHHAAPSAFAIGQGRSFDPRSKLGLQEFFPIVASFGFLTRSKRIDVALRAFAHLRLDFPNARYLLVGQEVDSFPVRDIVEQLGLTDHVQLVGYVDEPTFYEYLAAADICVNLRYPSAGETSGCVTRALAAGKPVVVSRYRQFNDIPDDCCVKLDLGLGEEERLYHVLKSLTEDNDCRLALGERARRYASTTCRIESSAAAYLDFLDEMRATDPRGSANIRVGVGRPSVDTEWRSMTSSSLLGYLSGFFSELPAALPYLGVHARRFRETLDLIPQLPRKLKVLEVGGALGVMAILLRKYFGYEVICADFEPAEAHEKEHIRRRNPSTGEEYTFPLHRFNAEFDRFPFADWSFDLVLCCEVLEHLTHDPMFMLSETNRVLKPSGRLVLTTPNIARSQGVAALLDGEGPYLFGKFPRHGPRGDRHNREYSPGELRRLLEFAGFGIEVFHSADVWNPANEEALGILARLGKPTDLRGECLMVRARWLGPVRERYPREFYE